MTLSPTRVRETAQKRQRIGKFGQQLLAHLIDGKVIANEYEADGYTRGDVENTDIEVLGDSKARDNNHPFDLTSRQLGRYQHREFFDPNFRRFYGLISYRNREPKKRGAKYPGHMQSPLARLHTAEEQLAFVASKIDGIYLIDLVVASSARRFYYERRGGMLNEEDEKTVVLRRADLRRLCEPTRETFRLLGLNPRRWVARHYKGFLRLRMDKLFLEISAPIHMLMDAELDERLNPIVRRHEFNPDVDLF
jgi:hypothetical protein